MATRVVLSQCLRQFAARSPSFLALPKFYSSGSMLLKIEGSRLSFARSFATDELPSEEVDPNAAVVIDEKEASKMRTRIIPVEVSMRYLKSKGKFSTEVIKYVINNKGICLKVIQLHMALKQSG